MCAPGAGWRITTISTFMDKILFTVSSSVSPLLTEDELALKLITSALNRFSASSNEMRVRVEFSKNKLAIVTSLSEGTFLIGLLMTSLNWSEVSKMSSMSSRVIYFIPSRCFVLSCWLAILWFYVVFVCVDAHFS